MAVASGEKALSALTQLVSGDRIQVQSVLRDCYLPKGLEPSNNRILMKPGTLMGEYGDEARYALAPDQATRYEIARAPADVLSGRPMISRDETVRKYVKRSLDLTMKGGTTSGVVYPLAICELATDFRFRNVGGTSAGAIVAALTAAAELGRSGQVLAACQSSHKESPREEMPAAAKVVSSGASQERHLIRPGFTGLADIISWLTQIRPGDPKVEEYRLAQLFRPGRATAPIFRIVVAIMRGRRLSLPLLALFAFGWGTPLLAVALILGAVVLTGWLEARFTGATYSVSAIVGFGALGVLTIVLFASGLTLVILSIRSVLAARRHPAARENSLTEENTRLEQLRNHTSQYPMRRRRTGLRVVTGVAMIVAALVLGSLRPALYVIAPLVGLAAGLIMLFGLFRSVFNYVGRFRSRAFGLVLGNASQRRRSPLDVLAGVPKATVDKSLIPWLNDCLNALAGLPAHEVLRFGHLWSGLNYHERRCSPSQADLDQWQSMWERRDHRLVNLELMTTDLTRQRPFRFPLDPSEGDDSEQLWVCVDQLHDGESPMFPEPITKALREGKRQDVRDDQGEMLRLHQLPDQRDLPIIFVVRMSMSLPALFQAVRLYRIQPQMPPQDDFGRALGNPLQLRALHSSTESVQELWFSDGGITSNFPVHFFDNALPRWPTVSLDLGIHPDDAPHEDIWLPQDWESPHTPVKTLGGSGFEFGQAIFNTAMSWRDSLQSSLPGYRNRIAQVRTSPGEGGTNLFMPREVIASLALRGAFAGARLRTRFLDTPQWNRFRWLRLRTAMNNFERLRADIQSRRGFYEDVFKGQWWLTEQERDFSEKPEQPIGWYRPQRGFWPKAARLLNTFADAYRPPRGDRKRNVMTYGTPEPYPVVRQVPRE